MAGFAGRKPVLCRWEASSESDLFILPIHEETGIFARVLKFVACHQISVNRDWLLVIGKCPLRQKAQ